MLLSEYLLIILIFKIVVTVAFFVFLVWAFRKIWSLISRD